MISFPIDPVKAPKTPEELLTQIRSLMESYHAADVDLLQEVFQNSVDALEDQFGNPADTATPVIELQIDFETGTVIIGDNGPGIPDDKIKKIVTPANTDKTGKRRRGHKGVGLAYAAWSCEEFRFATKRGKTPIVGGKLSGGMRWIRGELADYPSVQEDKGFQPSILKENDSGTVFSFRLGPNHELIRLLRRLNQSGTETLIRTWTAAGYVNLPSLKLGSSPSWVERSRISIKLGKSKPFTIPFAYFYRFRADLGRRHPKNRNVVPKIRQQVQLLRDHGILQALGEGRYRLEVGI